MAVALTFDVDGESAWLAEGPEYGRRLTLLSQARFGPERGLGRILDLLAELDIPGTFYVPGHTADHHPEAVAAIVAVERIWLEEYESARQDHRAITSTMHPEAIGRGYLLRMLRRVITGMLSRGRPWFATHAQIAALANLPATPDRTPRSHQRKPEPHGGTKMNQQRYHPWAPAACGLTRDADC